MALLIRAAICISPGTLRLLYGVYLCMYSSHSNCESSIEYVASLDVSMCASRPSALWRVGSLYISYNIIQMSKALLVSPWRSVVLACPVHNAIRTLCDTDAMFAPFVYVTKTCAVVPSYVCHCCTSGKSSYCLTFVGFSSTILPGASKFM